MIDPHFTTATCSIGSNEGQDLHALCGRASECTCICHTGACPFEAADADPATAAHSHPPRSTISPTE